MLIGQRLAEQLGLRTGDTLTLISPRGADDALRHGSAHQGLPGRGDLRSGHDGVRQHLRLHAAGGGAGLFSTAPGDVSVIEVFLDDADRSFSGAAGRINAAVERPILLTDWTQRNRTFFAALEVERKRDVHSS